MASLDPMLVCIAAAVFVLLAHGVFAFARSRAGGGEPGILADTAAMLLCGLAFLAPLSVLPFASGRPVTFILAGTMFAVVASAWPIVARRGRPDRTSTRQVSSFRMLRRRPGVRVVRVGAASAAAFAPPVRATVRAPAATPADTGTLRVTSPAPVKPGPDKSPGPAPDAGSGSGGAAPEPMRAADEATRALGQVDDIVTDVTSWLRLDH